MYYLLRLATIVLPWIPAWLRAYLGIGIGTIAWCVASDARAHANHNILHVLGQESLKTRQGRRNMRRIVRRMFQHNTRNYIEVCVLPHHTPAKHRKMTVETGFEHLDAALARGKGLVAFTAHYGPFDYIVQSAALRNYDVTVPVEALNNKRLLDLMLRLRSSHGINFIPLNSASTLRTIIQKLRSNKIVVLTTDRGSQGQKSVVPFFGTPTELPNGAVTLAQRTGAELVAAFCIRTSLTRIQLFCTPITIDMTEEQRQDTDYLLRRVSETMEQFIRAHPEQWFAFTPIWPTPQTQVQEQARAQTSGVSTDDDR
jgi:lauroyl/myristoyl acyltransferase